MSGTSGTCGFTEKTYYRAIIAGIYGKLSADGNKWADAVSGKAVTLEELGQVVEKQRADSR